MLEQDSKSFQLISCSFCPSVLLLVSFGEIKTQKEKEKQIPLEDKKPCTRRWSDEKAISSMDFSIHFIIVWESCNNPYLALQLNLKAELLFLADGTSVLTEAA